MTPKTCETCEAYAKSQKLCVMTNRQMGTDDFCSKHIEDAPICEICNQKFAPPIHYLLENDQYFIVCGQCAKSTSTCRLCKHSRICVFESSACSEPPMVQQEIRQGNMIMSTTVRNPKRIEQTCAKHCACYTPGPDGGCNREFNTCGKYQPIYYEGGNQ